MFRRARGRAIVDVLWPVVLGSAGAMAPAGCGDNESKILLTQEEIRDPAACQSCHPQQFQDWSGSMHAYAAIDPVFVAMNKRAQRETNGALGDFCVKCHAPVAVAEKLTTDGLNLSELPPAVKGVTCYFCHSAASIDGTHNNPLKLARDGTLFGPFGDPTAGSPHRSAYSPLFDVARPESAAACGSCHDIVNQHGAAVERTYSEWQSSLFSDVTLGQTCVRCHMNQSRGPASTASMGRVRSLGNHALPGVDVALTDFPETSTQRQLVQNLLDSTLSGTLCVTNAMKIELTLDNVASGHFVPSGASADRRLWAEITAYARDSSGAERVVYESGTVPADRSVETIDDPDLWLVRDCLFDGADEPVHMFWEAARAVSNAIPGAVKPTVLDPSSFTRSHVRYLYPTGTAALPVRPDRVTLKVFIKPVGDDILADLVASGDLDPAVPPLVPRFLFAQTNLEWTAATGKVPIDATTHARLTGLSCVTTAAQYLALPGVAVSNARCRP